MPPSSPPKAVAVEVVPAQPTEADRAAIAHLSARAGKPLPEIAYLVKIRLETIPEATAQGWALYIGDFRVPKYWAYKHGIYFKVFDSHFFEDHRGQPLRLSQNGTDFTETGLKLAVPHLDVRQLTKQVAKLPLQDDALK